VSGDVSLNVVVDSGEIDVVVEEFSVSLDVEESVVAALLVSGPVGPAGPQGPAGSVFSGVAWWYGSGPPSTVVGSKPGDFYMDLVTGNIHKLGD